MLTQSPQAAQGLLESHQATRIAVFVRTKSPLYSHPADEAVRAASSTLNIHAPPTLLAIEKWDRLDVLVFDVFHDAYDWSTAHQEVNLPVILVDYGKRYSVVKEAGPEFRKEVNGAIARELDLNRWDVRPPYVADQTRMRAKVPTYPNPRHMITLTPESAVQLP